MGQLVRQRLHTLRRGQSLTDSDSLLVGRAIAVAVVAELRELDGKPKPRRDFRQAEKGAVGVVAFRTMHRGSGQLPAISLRQVEDVGNLKADGEPTMTRFSPSSSPTRVHRTTGARMSMPLSPLRTMRPIRRQVLNPATLVCIGAL